MSFDDDCRELEPRADPRVIAGPFDAQDAAARSSGLEWHAWARNALEHATRPKMIVQSVVLSPEERRDVRTATMSALCKSIPPNEWILLSHLSERTRHGILAQCVRLMLKRRRADVG